MKLVRKNPAPSSSALPPRPRPAANREAPRRVVAPRSQSSAKPLPRPRRAGAGKGLVAAALLAMLAVAAAGYWVTRDNAQRDSLRQDIGAFLADEGGDIVVHTHLVRSKYISVPRSSQPGKARIRAVTSVSVVWQA